MKDHRFEKVREKRYIQASHMAKHVRTNQNDSE